MILNFLTRYNSYFTITLRIFAYFKSFLCSFVIISNLELRVFDHPGLIRELTFLFALRVTWCEAFT